ncbi:MAG TPA: diguanylate cyclase [Stenotrophomonas sp.]
MIKPEKPKDEAKRLEALQRYKVLDTPPERAFDDLVQIATTLCGTQMGAVSLIDRDRQWFKARKGLGASETPREFAFCAHAILTPDQVFTVEDAEQDVRFIGNPYVTGDPHLRFYAGAPLLGSEGEALGTLCVFDDTPATLTEEQRQALEALSRQASHLLELRRVAFNLDKQLRERDWYEQQLAQYSESLETLNADLAEQTRTDVLTGLPNRRAFAAALAAETARDPDAAQALSVAVIDIDHFKTINDLHGHDQGDQVLVALAALLRAHSAGRGMIARVGGEEFVMLLPGTALEPARLQCEFLRQEIAVLPINLPVTVSIGVAQLQPGERAEQCLKRADQALYLAKHQGRDRVAVAGAG